MRAALASPPTARALDVVELLARRADQPLALAALVRELGITRATAHAILTTLSERGWALRDPIGKTYRLGAGLMLAARSADATASLENLTRTAAAALSRKVGMATSVMQIVGDAVVISDFVAPEGDRQDARPGDRIPYVAPFAQSFVAWEPRAARRAWLARSGIANRAVEDRLEAVLAAIRNSGHAVQYMSLAVARAVHAIGALQQETLSDAMRDIIERLLVEITSLEYLPHELQAGKTYSVSAITAPVFDARGRVALSIGVHPFRELSRARIERIARMTTRATQELSRGTAPLVD